MDKLVLPEKVRTVRLILQRLKYEDAEEIFYTYASKPDVTKYVSWPTHRSIEDTRNFLRYALDGWNSGSDFSYSIRIAETKQLIGTFGFINEQGKVQFGYALGPLHWNKGFATEVCKQMMEVIKDCNQVFRVNTFVDVENVQSIRVLEKSGLFREATLQKWFRFVNQDMQPKDCYLYALPFDR
jgi:[ribosomal protein S5]-alanine N-acetyltransferase